MNHQHDELEEEEFVRLNWVGPFSYGEDGLAESLLDRFGPSGKKKKLDAILNKSGLYTILGDHALHGPRSLLYIGETESFKQRFLEHDSWVSEEDRVEVYVAKLKEPQRRKDVESLLIYAHSPIYNSRNVAEPPKLKPHLRVWNEGRYWKLFPEVSSQHEWYGEC